MKNISQFAVPSSSSDVNEASKKDISIITDRISQASIFIRSDDYNKVMAGISSLESVNWNDCNNDQRAALAYILILGYYRVNILDKCVEIIKRTENEGYVIKSLSLIIQDLKNNQPQLFHVEEEKKEENSTTKESNIVEEEEQQEPEVALSNSSNNIIQVALLALTFLTAVGIGYTIGRRVSK